MLRGGRNLSSLGRTPGDSPGQSTFRSLPRPRLLVVDDEQAIREWLRRALDALEYDVVEARDAPAALQVLQSSHVDGAILDVRLVGHSGLEVLEYVRFHHRAPLLPVIILTGVSHLSEGEQETIRQHQAYVLYKPEAVDHIAEMLEKLVRRRQSPPA